MEISNFINLKDKLPVVLFSVLILTIIGSVIQGIGYQIYSYLPTFLQSTDESIFVVIFFIYLIVLFFIFKSLYKKVHILILHLLRDKYKFASIDWPNNWIFSGKPELKNSAELLIGSTRAGSLLKNHYWRNCKISFEMKWLENRDKKIGIVFRAEDLDNYFMLELSNKIGVDANGHPYDQREFKPHVRYHGGWDVVYPTKTVSLDSKEYIRIVLEVKDKTVYLYVNNHLEFVWTLPTHVDVAYREHGSDGKEKSEFDEKYVKEIPFRNAFGMVGFRAHYDQAAIIRGLTVDPF